MNGTENPADLFTKHMDSAAKLDGLVARFGCVFREGPYCLGPSLEDGAFREQKEVRRKRTCGTSLGIQRRLLSL